MTRTTRSISALVLVNGGAISIAVPIDMTNFSLCLEWATGPIPASRKVLQRAGISTADLDVVELNEAFASQVVACLDELGFDWRDEDRVNPNGGAIALGHPLGASGARLAGKSALELRRRGKRYALVTMRIGVGQGIATVLEAL